MWSYTTASACTQIRSHNNSLTFGIQLFVTYIHVTYIFMLREALKVTDSHLGQSSLIKSPRATGSWSVHHGIDCNCQLASFSISLLTEETSPRAQKGASQYCCALVMPLLICSYVTNMTMFQDPSRRKEGMNLEKVRTSQWTCIHLF